MIIIPIHDLWWLASLYTTLEDFIIHYRDLMNAYFPLLLPFLSVFRYRIASYHYSQSLCTTQTISCWHSCWEWLCVPNFIIDLDWKLRWGQCLGGVRNPGCIFLCVPVTFCITLGTCFYLETFHIILESFLVDVIFPPRRQSWGLIHPKVPQA